MEEFLSEQLFFIFVTFVLLLIPGWFFLRAFFHRNQFTPLERFVLSVPISFALITLSIIAVNAFDVALTKHNILITLLAVTVPLMIASLFIKHKKLLSLQEGATKQSSSVIDNSTEIVTPACPVGKSQTDQQQLNEIASSLNAPRKDSHFTFSKKQTVTIIILVLFTIIVKGIFLINTVFPTAADLGHHMFWIEKITVEESLPTYEKIEINTNSNTLTFTSPEKIADFIVGEHIIFAVVKTFTKQSVISTFPSLILFVINIFTVLMLFIFARRIFEHYRYGSHIAILTLLFIGPLWAISGAGAKFVSGGVIGNLIGNLLIPTILYFLYRAFSEKRSLLLMPAIILISTLVYTHHLSTLIFGYIFIFSIIGFVFLQRDGWFGYKRLFSLLKNPYIVPMLLFALLAIFVFVPPSYLDRNTILSSVGVPSKSTRIGIPFSELMYMLGEARFIFGIIGLIILSIFYFLRRFGKFIQISKKNTPTNIYGAIFILGWGWALLGMSLVPHLLKVNILSSRIATYGAFPLAILSGFAIIWIVSIILSDKRKNVLMPQFIIVLFLFTILTFTFVSGLRDNATSINTAPKTNSALQTFHVGNYANKVFKNKIATGEFWIVKDHNYITADTWLKVFFANDYSFPLSRSYFKRYETHPDREVCTLNMISAPRTEFAKECFENLNVHAILVNTNQDAEQFNSSDDFYRIYQNNELSLFIRK